MCALLARATEQLRNETAAGYWIDNKGFSAEFLVKQIAKSLR